MITASAGKADRRVGLVELGPPHEKAGGAIRTRPCAADCRSLRSSPPRGAHCPAGNPSGNSACSATSKNDGAQRFRAYRWPDRIRPVPAYSNGITNRAGGRSEVAKHSRHFALPAKIVKNLFSDYLELFAAGPLGEIFSAGSPGAFCGAAGGTRVSAAAHTGSE